MPLIDITQAAEIRVANQHIRAVQVANNILWQEGFLAPTGTVRTELAGQGNNRLGMAWSDVAAPSGGTIEYRVRWTAAGAWSSWANMAADGNVNSGTNNTFNTNYNCALEARATSGSDSATSRVAFAGTSMQIQSANLS